MDINQKSLQELEQSSYFQDEYKNRAMFWQVDVSNIAEIREAVNTVVTKWKRIDILVNNAGVRRKLRLRISRKWSGITSLM
jgi:3-oxoacyl-[acyl-carrier protein] reductase